MDPPNRGSVFASCVTRVRSCARYPNPGRPGLAPDACPVTLATFSVASWRVSRRNTCRDITGAEKRANPGTPSQPWHRWCPGDVPAMSRPGACGPAGVQACVPAPLVSQCPGGVNAVAPRPVSRPWPGSQLVSRPCPGQFRGGVPAMAPVSNRRTPSSESPSQVVLAQKAAVCTSAALAPDHHALPVSTMCGT